MLAPAHDRVLKFDYRGAPQTVGVISRAALDSQRDYTTRQLAEDITGGLPSKAYLDEYLAIYYFLMGPCVRYMRDPRTVELVRSPQVVAKTIRSGRVAALDCDDMAALASGLILSSGGQARVVTVAFKNMFHNGRRQYSHVFAQGREPVTGKWITIDPVAGGKTKSMLRRAVAAKVWPIA